MDVAREKIITPTLFDLLPATAKAPASNSETGGFARLLRAPESGRPATRQSDDKRDQPAAAEPADRPTSPKDAAPARRANSKRDHRARSQDAGPAVTRSKESDSNQDVDATDTTVAGEDIATEEETPQEPAISDDSATGQKEEDESSANLVVAIVAPQVTATVVKQDAETATDSVPVDAPARAAAVAPVDPLSPSLPVNATVHAEAVASGELQSTPAEKTVADTNPVVVDHADAVVAPVVTVSTDVVTTPGPESAEAKTTSASEATSTTDPTEPVVIATPASATSEVKTSGPENPAKDSSDAENALTLNPEQTSSTNDAEATATSAKASSSSGAADTELNIAVEPVKALSDTDDKDDSSDGSSGEPLSSDHHAAEPEVTQRVTIDPVTVPVDAPGVSIKNTRTKSDQSANSENEATASISPNARPARSWLQHTGMKEATSTRDPQEIDVTRFLQRITRAFDVAQQRDGEIRIRLHPPELGSLRIDMQINDGQLTARLQTETAEARSALLEHLPLLKERLAEQNIRVERFDVDLFDAGGQSPQQSGDQLPREERAQAAANRARTTGSLPAEEPENVVRRTPQIEQKKINIVI